MWPAVRDAFAKFTETFEGHCDFMYCDVLGLVTTGRGNLIDPIGQATGLPWQFNGQCATLEQVAQGWMAVKARQDLKLYGGGAYRNISALRLTESAIDDLTVHKMLEMETYLKARVPNWEELPADAQLGTLSIAWACGPAVVMPKFFAALVAEDFATCAVECHLEDSHNPGLRPRNAANVQLFVNAAQCLNADLPRGLLQYC